MTAAPALSIATQDEPEAASPPSPALPPLLPWPRKAEPRLPKAAAGKQRSKLQPVQPLSAKTTRKKVGRALDDADTGQDFSELVEELLQQWLASRT